MNAPSSTDDRRKAICAQLDDLIRLDYDAIEAYDAAISRITTPHYREALERFREDHARHTRELAAQVMRLGRTPSDGPGPLVFLTKGKVVIGGLIGETAVLWAMKANEMVTNMSYDAALEALAGEAEVEALVRRNRDDERRHQAWIDATLASSDSEDESDSAST